MTTNEKRRVVVYIAGQLKKYKEAMQLNDEFRNNGQESSTD